jgi:Pregnancy-associated plasma protein-A
MRMLNKLCIAFAIAALASCGGGGNSGGGNDRSYEVTGIIRIPTVVHVLYEEDIEDSNISVEKINSQITALNEDFRRGNEDIVNVPAEFADRVADIEIEFELATVDPDGGETDGITRTPNQATTSEAIYFTNSGGKDAWPADQYLNIWVKDGADRHGEVPAPGYGQPPGGDPLTDGIVVAYQAFGTIRPLVDGLRKGRTATHEIGHWLNLRHIYAVPDDCSSSDFVDDTPTAYGPYSGNPTHPSASCGSSDMFMNFMDRSADETLIMFSEGQKVRMREVFAMGAGRSDLYLNIRNDG